MRGGGCATRGSLLTDAGDVGGVTDGALSERTARRWSRSLPDPDPRSMPLDEVSKAEASPPMPRPLAANAWHGLEYIEYIEYRAVLQGGAVSRTACAIVVAAFVCIRRRDGLGGNRSGSGHGVGVAGAAAGATLLAQPRLAHSGAVPARGQVDGPLTRSVQLAATQLAAVLGPAGRSRVGHIGWQPAPCSLGRNETVQRLAGQKACVRVCLCI